MLVNQISSIEKTNAIFQLYISLLKNPRFVLKVKPTPLLYLLSELLKLLEHSQAVARRYSVKRVLLKIPQCSQGFAKLVPAILLKKSPILLKKILNILQNN